MTCNIPIMPEVPCDVQYTLLPKMPSWRSTMSWFGQRNPVTCIPFCLSALPPARGALWHTYLLPKMPITPLLPKVTCNKHCPILP